MSAFAWMGVGTQNIGISRMFIACTIIYEHVLLKRQEFLVNWVLIAPLSAGARNAEVRWAVLRNDGCRNLYGINGR